MELARLRVFDIKLFFSINSEKILSKAPAAPRVCPVCDFVELMGGILSLKTFFIDSNSTGSPAGVEVP